MNLSSFFAELRRRNVIRAAGLYLVGAWLVVQVAGTVLPMFGAPEWLPRTIVVLLAIGFVPAVIFSWVFELTPQGLKREDDVVSAQSITPQTGRRMDRMIIVVLVLALGYFAFDKFVLAPRREAGLVASALPNESKSVIDVKSIAVLPFVNMGADKTDEYLSDGVSEELIIALSKITGLKVKARTSSFAFKNKNEDIQKIGELLHVSHLLEGSVARAGNKLRITAQLIQASNGNHLWSDTYDREMQDIFAVRSEVAQHVALTLKVRLLGEEKERVDKKPTENLEAYKLYLRGRYFWNKRTPDGIKQAIEQFQQSIDRDPNFALGYAGLADSYIALTFYNFAAPHEAMPKAKESALKAMALDDTVAEPHASLGNILMNYDWNWPAAEKAFKRSIELKPDYATGHEWYAIHYLIGMGRLDDAVEEMKKALELEPASLIMNTFMGATLYYAGRYDAAIDQCRRTIEMDPNFAVAHWHLGLAYEQKQVFDAAIEEFKKATSLSGGSPLMKAAPGRAYAESQKQPEAKKILNELNELSKQEYVSSYEVATIYVALGDSEQAFQFLEKAYAEHSFHLIRLNVSPYLKPIRSDPRFQDLVRRLSLSR
jgi:TolB-like protein/Tfp pilus assembly protein PilF